LSGHSSTNRIRILRAVLADLHDELHIDYSVFVWASDGAGMSLILHAISPKRSRADRTSLRPEQAGPCRQGKDLTQMTRLRMAQRMSRVLRTRGYQPWSCRYDCTI